MLASIAIISIQIRFPVVYHNKRNGRVCNRF
jgi:hypothetical protein